MDDYNCCDYEREYTLSQLAEKYGTDKLTHGYIEFYEQHLPPKPTRILEIGCLTGASLRMWREYFPDTDIHCLDLFEEHPQPTDIPGVIYWKGDQTDQKVLEQLRKLHFDVIIEDASHNLISQWVTFHSLVGCTDLYVLEDAHTVLDEPYRQGFDLRHSMLSAMQKRMFPYPLSLYLNKIAFIYAD
jgi:23S rRNA U2552 (ribose-2'-O)-methylase RlmE/FtsJ